MPVHFFRPEDSYGGFSNFSCRHGVRIYGHDWRTSEHAYQAMKFYPHRLDIVWAVKRCTTPGQAATMGRNRALPLSKTWDLRIHETALAARLPDHAALQVNDGHDGEPLLHRTKDVIMYEVVYAKASQHPDLRALLLGTGDERIVEASFKDAYWGWGKDDQGKNKLGRIFMAIRLAFVRTAAEMTVFGKPACLKFVCTAALPWRPEFGSADHPDAVLSRSDASFECPHCGATDGPE